MKQKLAGVLLLASLGGCSSHGAETASEATDAANAQLTKELPQMQGHLDGFDIKSRDLGDKWRVEYHGGTGGAIIYVNRRTGQATIVKISQ